jgi:8-oxo-dGTP pyrophosphatase MutT (NUDIX family)
MHHPSEARWTSPADQAAALCHRVDHLGVLRVLLVTSSRGRWILPKGSVEPGQNLATTALQEAWEEAGVHGYVTANAGEDCLGHWVRTRRDGTQTVIGVVPVWVDELARVWPEDHRRQRRWASLREALELVDDESLRRALIHLAKVVMSRQMAA